MVVIRWVRPMYEIFGYIFCLHFYLFTYFVYNFIGKRSPQSAHFVESDYGPPLKYAELPEIGER